MADKKSHRYVQIYLDLKSRILGGTYPPGGKIPVEKDLLKEYDTSITTLRRAVEMLSNEGLLSKRQGSGVFVRADTPSAEKKHSGGKKAAEPVRKRIAVVMPDVSRITPSGDMCHWQLNLRKLNGIYREAVERDVYVSVFDMSEKFELAAFDGVIVFRCFELEQPPVFETLTAPLREKGIPWAVVSEYDLRFSDRYWIVENLEREFLTAYAFLRDKKIRKLLVLGRFLNDSNPRVRAMKYLPEPFECVYLENATSDRAGARSVMERFLASGGDPRAFDALFCLTDLQALGAMDVLLAADYRIPRDIGVMGCDNIADGKTYAVPLTTFQFTGPDVGRTALDVLLRAIANPDTEGFAVHTNCRIVERVSLSGGKAIR